MSDEEKKAKRAAYMVKWKANLNAFIKERRRLKNNEYRKKAREKWSPEYLEKMRERNRVYYANNKEILLAKMKIYQENKKQENHDDSKGKRKVD
jgi:hypothetical protein